MTAFGQWTASAISISVGRRNLHPSPASQYACVDVDVGLKVFAVLSDGTVYPPPKFFCPLEKTAAKAQRIAPDVRKAHRT